MSPNTASAAAEFFATASATTYFPDDNLRTQDKLRYENSVLRLKLGEVVAKLGEVTEEKQVLEETIKELRAGSRVPTDGKKLVDLLPKLGAPEELMKLLRAEDKGEEKTLTYKKQRGNITGKMSLIGLRVSKAILKAYGHKPHMGSGSCNTVYKSNEIKEVVVPIVESFLEEVPFKYWDLPIAEAKQKAMAEKMEALADKKNK